MRLSIGWRSYGSKVGIGTGCDRRPALPQSLGGEPGPFSQRLKLEPDDFGVHLHPPGEGTKTAIDPGYDVVASDHIGVADKTLRHQFRVLDEIRCGVDHPRNNGLVLRQ